LNKDQLTVADYYGEIVGSGNFKRVLGPALDAVVCQPAAEVPANAVFRKKPRRKEVLRSFTAPGGTQGFADDMAEQGGLEIRTGSAVSRLERGGEGYRLRLEDGGEIGCRSLALAVAPDVAARLLQSAMPAVAALLAPMEMAAIESQAVLVRSERLDLEPLAGIIAAADDFYSVVSRDPVPDETYRAFTFHFRPGRLHGAGRLTRICDVLGIKAGDVVAEAYKQNRLPALRLGHKERIAELDRLLDSTSLAVTGNWFLGVSIEDALTRSAAECERLFGKGGDTE
jgi:protoporphyrinogen oxidase